MKKDKIKKIKDEIKLRKELLSSTVVKSISRTCEWCGCPGGIHKSNCRFILKYC